MENAFLEGETADFDPIFFLPPPSAAKSLFLPQPHLVPTPYPGGWGVRAKKPVSHFEKTSQSPPPGGGGSDPP